MAWTRLHPGDHEHNRFAAARVCAARLARASGVPFAQLGRAGEPDVLQQEAAVLLMLCRSYFIIQ
eukprot:3000740-Prymnesium_polylepis.2